VFQTGNHGIFSRWISHEEYMPRKLAFGLVTLMVLGTITVSVWMWKRATQEHYEASVSLTEDWMQVVLSAVGGENDRRIALIQFPSPGSLPDEEGRLVIGGSWLIRSDKDDYFGPSTETDPVPPGMDRGTWCFHAGNHKFALSPMHLIIDGQSWDIRPKSPTLTLDYRKSTTTGR
jgi:hypothetical protein